jgi:hypothetical protein
MQLVVGAPSHKIGDGTRQTHAVGKLFAYDITLGSQAAPIFTIEGEAEYTRLGRYGQRPPTHTPADTQRESV